MHIRKVESSSQERNEFLQFLDTEIEDLRAEQQVPGWSIWAITGAIATCIWLVFGILEKEASVIDLTDLGLLIITLILFSDFLIISVRFLRSKVKDVSSESRFKTGMLFFGRNRLELILSMIIYVFFIIVSWYTAFDLGIISYKTVAFIYFGVMICLSFCGIAISCSNLFFSVQNKTISLTRSKWVIPFIFFLPLGVALYGYTAATYSQLHLISIDELRLATLFCAVVYLIQTLPQSATDQTLIDFFVKIRRSIGLRQLDTNSAFKEVEILLLGNKLNEVLKNDVTDIVSLLERAAKEYVIVNSILDGVNNLINTDTVEITDKELGVIKNISSIGPAFNRVTKILELFSKRQKFYVYLQTIKKEQMFSLVSRVRMKRFYMPCFVCENRIKISNQNISDPC